MFARNDAVWVVPHQQGAVLFKGRGQALTAQEAAILVVLTEHPGEVISSEVLAKAIWPAAPPDTCHSRLSHIMWGVRAALKGTPITIKPVYIKRTLGPGHGTLYGWKLIGDIAIKRAEIEPDAKREPDVTPTNGNANDTIRTSL